MNQPNPDHSDDSPEMFTHLPLTVPPDIDLRVGYEGENRWLGYWYEVRTDGYETAGGAAANWRDFEKWNREAGMQLLRASHEATAEEGEEFDPPEVTPRLSFILHQYLSADLGSDGSMATHGLLFDLDEQQVYVGEVDHIREFCRRFNDPPEWLGEMPDDPDEAYRVFKRALSEMGDDDLFGSDGGEHDG